MKTKIANISKGESYDVYIGRKGHGHDGYFGNPFDEGNRSEKIRKFTKYAALRIQHDPAYKKQVKELHGKTLGCFCHPLPCHGDVLAKIAEQLNVEEDVFEIHN